LQTTVDVVAQWQFVQQSPDMTVERLCSAFGRLFKPILVLNEDFRSQSLGHLEVVDAAVQTLKIRQRVTIYFSCKNYNVFLL
jgi:hypothetical protein